MDKLTSRERRQVEWLSNGSRLVESIAVASLSLRKLRKDLPRRFLYRSHEEFFLKHGRLFTPRPFPLNEYRKWRGKPKACLYNAVELALSFPELDYVEGYALPAKGLQLPMPHSWCVDGEGKVVDPTWHKVVGREYFGLALDKGILREQHQRGLPFGLLFNEGLFQNIASGKIKDWRKWLAKRRYPHALMAQERDH